VIQDGKAVIAGAARRPGDEDLSLALARLDDTGALDTTFGSDGVTLDRPAGTGSWDATALALWNGKLVLAGRDRVTRDASRSNYVLARYSADGAIDETFNPDVPEPGHVVTTTGDGRRSEAVGLAVDPETGTATIVGRALHGGRDRLLIDRFTSEGVRDPSFVGANGNGGPVLLDAGQQRQTLGADVVLDDRGGTLVSGSTIMPGRYDLVLARYGDTAPTPNAKPFARIRGHHTVPRKTRVTFRGGRSFDTDGEIVRWDWKVGHGRFHNRGPILQHRFGRTGKRTVILRVTDDGGAVGFARFRVKVVSRRG
jgi:uncharacterized delta-60 repeat protein